jgi:hypothetical protein
VGVALRPKARRVRRCVAFLAGCGAVFILAACGGGRSISTDAGAKALATAGFHHLLVHRHTEIATDLEGEIDEVDLGPHPRTRDWVRAQLIDFDSSKRAVSFFKVEALRPPYPYAANKLSTYRICNVVFWSYNPHDDPRVESRAQRVAKLLRAQCR